MHKHDNLLAVVAVPVVVLAVMILKANCFHGTLLIVLYLRLWLMLVCICYTGRRFGNHGNSYLQIL